MNENIKRIIVNKFRSEHEDFELKMKRTKQIFIILGIGIFLVGLAFVLAASNKEESKRTQSLRQVSRGTIQEVTIDSCQYITWNYYEAGGIIHKANCKNH